MGYIFQLLQKPKNTFKKKQTTLLIHNAKIQLNVQTSVKAVKTVLNSNISTLSVTGK